jgi:hypothetical protein
LIKLAFGRETFNRRIDPSGKTNLAVGTEGSYEMSFNFIKENSTSNQEVIFYGLANQLLQMSILQYILRNCNWLVDDQLGSVSAKLKYMKQNSFHAELKMKGELLEPVVDFDILFARRK